MALGRAGMSVSNKRMVEEQEESTTKRCKRRKYDLLREDWGMAGTEEYNNFLYSGLEGVRRNKEQENAPIMKKSKKSRALEEVSRRNHKISDWIVPDEQYKMEELVSEASIPPQIERDGVGSLMKKCGTN